MHTVVRYKFNRPGEESPPPSTEPEVPSGPFVTGLFDPDSLDDVPRPDLKDKGWTFGNSADLLKGSESESPWVTVGWIAVPSAMATLILLAMFYA